MVEVGFLNEIEDELMIISVVVAKCRDKWVLCKHKKRDTYELPGGHREDNETLLETARRELMEETGAIDFTIKEMCPFSVKGKTKINKTENDISYGMAYCAEIFSFGKIDSEMEKIILSETLEVEWTYPLIHPMLVNEAVKRKLI